MKKIRFREDILPLKNKLYRLALRITLNPAEAEDVVQDTLLKVWNARSEWTSLESVEAYCLTLTKNLAIDKSRLSSSKTQTLPEEAESIADRNSPHDQMVNMERMQLIHQIIDELPEKQRIIIQLRDIEGKSYREIAQVLRISEEQVKVNLFRARQKVKQKYMEIDGYGL